MRKNKKNIFQKARFRYQLKRSKWKNGKRKRKNENQIKNHEIVFVERMAPIIFNLKPENVERVLKFINQVKAIGKSGKSLMINLSKVEDIGIGAISMLISTMSELNDEGIVFKGNKPLSSNAKNILEQSGFMKFVNGKIKPSNKNSLNTIITGKKETSHTEILDVIHASMNTIWGVNGRSPQLYSIIVEMIKNSCKHAFKSDYNVRWHLAVTHDTKNQLVKFSFVDNGIGVIDSYKMDDFFKQTQIYFKNDADFIEGAFTEGIKSKTGLSWRGTGLPTIFEAFDENIIKNFVVVTNNAYCNFGSNKKNVIKNKFMGTYYYWEIDTSCEKHCFI
jgi:hypothetical protein